MYQGSSDINACEILNVRRTDRIVELPWKYNPRVCDPSLCCSNGPIRERHNQLDNEWPPCDCLHQTLYASFMIYYRRQAQFPRLYGLPPRRRDVKNIEGVCVLATNVQPRIDGFPRCRPRDHPIDLQDSDLSTRSVLRQIMNLHNSLIDIHVRAAGRTRVQDCRGRTWLLSLQT